MENSRINKIIQWLTGLFKHKADLSRETNDLKSKLLQAEVQIEVLKNKLSTAEHTLNQGRYLISVETGDPSPKDKEQRVLYVAQVAGFHKDILKPKLTQMIARAHEVLADSDKTRSEDQAIKGMIFGFWEIIRWGESMVGEYMSNIHPDEDINIFNVNYENKK